MTSEKKIVWITGASSGIGASLSKIYSEQGWFVILSSRRKEQLEIVRIGLFAPDDAYVQVMDMASLNSIQKASEEVYARFSKVDLLINNAGISQRSKVLDTPLSVFRQLMEVNYHGVVSLTKEVLPHMIRRGSGHVAAISSIAGKVGAPSRSGYAASKHALHGFFDCLRAEQADNGINVTIICPGYARTNVDVNALDKSGQAAGKQDKANQSGMHPDTLAQKIYHAIRKKKNEVYFGGFEVLAVYLKRFLPNLLAKILLKRNRAL